MASPRLIERLRAEGILRPQATVDEAQRAGLRIALACALLEKESGGGRNVFGHDPTIFTGAGEVTPGKYRDYKQRRVASGNKLMQGVGPCQLTWWEFQDTADREGGCWKPEVNMRIGFRHLAELVKQHGEADGARRYNGAGPAAEAYSRDLLVRARTWEAKLGGVHAGGPRVVRRGDSGVVVARITQRLAFVRSRRTGKPYLVAAQRRLDVRGEAAVKAFQRDSGLTADGVFGPASAQALNRAVRLEKTRRERSPKPAPSRPATPVRPATPSRPATPARPAPTARPPLVTLVDQLRHGDAETDESWDRLVAYSGKRRRLLAELRGAAREGADLGDVAKVLLRIEDKIEALVDLEHAEAAAVEGAAVVASEAADAEAPPPPAPKPPSPASGPPTPASEPSTPAHGANGAGDGAAPPAPRRVKLSELSDAELERRVQRLDRVIGAIRTMLISRYAHTEKELAQILPRRPARQPLPGPSPAPSPAPTPVPLPVRPRRKPTSLKPAEVRSLQKSLNRFSRRYLKGLAPLMVDGVKGHATERRIVTVKYYLGYTGKPQRQSKVDPKFVRRMRHPRSIKHSGPGMLTRAAFRRSKQRKAATAAAAPTGGVTTFDGRPVAAWLKPYLEWARVHGWKGTLNSGWRDPAYSEKLCISMCGAKSCPGRCAGRSSNHSGSSKPMGAVDVSDYGTFGQLMRQCPYSPHLFNALGAADPVHFSASGR